MKEGYMYLPTNKYLPTYLWAYHARLLYIQAAVFYCWATQQPKTFTRAMLGHLVLREEYVFSFIQNGLALRHRLEI